MLNKIVTSPFISGSATCTELLKNYQLETFEDLLYFAISNSAYEIILPYAYCEPFGIDKNNFIPLLKKRIKIVDSNKKIFNQIKKVVDEILDDISKSEKGKFDFRFNCANIIDFLYKTMLGCKYDAEVDVEFFNRINESVNNLLNNVENKSVKLMLSEINGIENLYDKKQIINSLELRKNTSIQATKDRIEELFDDLNMYNLSKYRHQIGINRDLEMFSLKSKNLIRDISRSKSYSNLVKRGKQFISLTKNVIPYVNILPDFSNIYNEKYSPPIYCFDKVRRNILEENSCGEYALTPLYLSIDGEIDNPLF